MSYNKVILIGNVGKEPEVKYFDNNNCVANFTLATNEGGYTRSNGDVVPEQTDWHNITTFRDVAKFVERNVRKGARLLVEGRIRYRSYVDSNNISRMSTEIIADKVQFYSFGRRDRSESSGEPNKSGNSGSGAANNGSNSDDNGRNAGPNVNDRQRQSFQQHSSSPSGANAVTNSGDPYRKMKEMADDDKGNLPF